MKRKIMAAVAALALAGVVSGLAPTPSVSTSTPVIGGLAATGAEAGIGYWSNGCNPHAEWFENAGEHNWRLFTRNEYNPANTQFVIIHNLRRTYQGAGNECGSLAELTSNEYRTSEFGNGCAAGTPACLRSGWRQNMVFGHIFWGDDCSQGFVYLNGVGRVRTNLCQYIY